MKARGGPRRPRAYAARLGLLAVSAGIILCINLAEHHRGEPLAYFISFHTYGSWLHGREQGSVDREHNQIDTPFLATNVRRHEFEHQIMQHPVFVLNDAARRMVCRTIIEVCNHRQWILHALHVRTNHVHVVVTATVKPEKVMGDLKAWSTRRLREALLVDGDSPAWARHGSTIYLWSHDQIEDKIDYTLNRQGPTISDTRHPDER